MYDEDRFKKPFWSLWCESASPTCSTSIDKVYDTLRNLQKELPELFPTPPKATRWNGVDQIAVYASSESAEEIKRSAETIRKHVDYPFIMYFYKKCTYSENQRKQYFHSPDDEFYKFSGMKNFDECYWEQTVERRNKKSTYERLSLSQVIPGDRDEFERENDEKEGEWTIFPGKKGKQQRPSMVTERDRIHLPLNEDDFEKAQDIKGGKWIVHCSDWESLDNLWEKLIPLYHQGVLVALRSCTKKSNENVTKRDPSYHTLAIMCYTADADCKSSVQRAAECIYRCTGYNSIMYYKTNMSSKSGKYRQEGHINVSKYIITVKGNMFEKDRICRWKKVDFLDETDK